MALGELVVSFPVSRYRSPIQRWTIVSTFSFRIWDDSPDVPPRVALCGAVWHSLGRAQSPNLNPTNDFRPSPAYSGTLLGNHAPKTLPLISGGAGGVPWRILGEHLTQIIDHIEALPISSKSKKKDPAPASRPPR